MNKRLIAGLTGITAAALTVGIAAPVALANTEAPMTAQQSSIVSTAKQDADNAVITQLEANPSETVNGNYFKIQEMIAAAATQEGVPYKLNTQIAFNGFDCSNFTAWAYKQVGVDFSGSSVTQRYHVGTPVPLNDIQPGDLLFFKTANNATGGGHVGLYVGNGNVLQCGGGWGRVTEEPLNGTWLGKNLVFARRVIQ